MLLDCKFLTNRSPIMDFSPLAAITSPGVAFLYTGIFVYACICIAIGFKIAHSRCRDKNVMGMPPPVTFTLAGLCFTLFFVVFLIPFFILCLIYTAASEHAFKSRRPRREEEIIASPSPPRPSPLRFLNLWDLSSNLSSSDVSSDSGSEATTISSHGTPPPQYSQHHRDTRIDLLTDGAQPETPPPAYFPPDRISGETLTDGSNQGSRT
ncbi:uncharacterized protein F4817DRAFT_347660 [Daldinia loculata]|uniref:uncharacterized protein n=1 Tax=Daldinia loculata TaxID=103429 RepID=UPI0020C22A67|nr:uncharacterized protein F4817DRAFT_347660 [Daldinia loculata]KAI1644100.1 hypothetical protein F4817DRAFT_347660 [Daldinia loculata]